MIQKCNGIGRYEILGIINTGSELDPHWSYADPVSNPDPGQ